MAAHIAGPLYWERHGSSGHPMLFVHPNPMDHTCWLYQLAHLSTWFRTVGVDLPGYGRSPRAEVGVSMDDVALACWDALDQSAGEPAILVGLSVGGEVIRRMAHQRPEHTLALIIAGHGYRPVRANMAAPAVSRSRIGSAAASGRRR